MESTRNRARRLLLGFSLALPLLLSGCIKSGDGAGAVNGTKLYLYDGAASQILVWNDLATTYDAAATPAADLTLTSSALARSKPVGWGGMALDTSRNCLYLLYQDGSVIRIGQLRSQSGAIASSDLVLFTLDSSQRLTGSVFGQLALDSQTDTLYACESGSSGTSRVWTVSSPDTLPNSGTAPLAVISDDESGTGSLGVAAGQSSVFAYFAGGNQVTSSSLTTYNGPRLRGGTRSAFGASDVIIGDTTGLDQSATGSMAFDTAGNTVFVGLDTGSTSAGSPTSGAPVLAFQTGQFGLSPNQQPHYWMTSLGTGTLAAIAHAGTKAWLAGVQTSGGAGVQEIVVWKQPASGVVSKPLVLGPSTALYRAVAMDGTGS